MTSSRHLILNFNKATCTENFVNFPDRQKAVFPFLANFSSTLNSAEIGIIFSKVAP